MAAAENPEAVVKIDLASQTLTTPGGRKVEFPIDSSSKHCLLEGVDELGYILQHEAYIATYEARRVGSIDTRVCPLGPAPLAARLSLVIW